MRELVDLAHLVSGDPGTSLDGVLVQVPGPTRPLAQGLDLRPGGVQVMRVGTGVYEFAIGVNTRAIGGHLLVTFNGGRNDDDDGASAFRHLTWSVPLQTAVLAFSDPQSEARWPGPTPRSSSFFCRLDHAPDDEINALIDRAANELGIAPDRVVLYGTSVGGAAAMRIAASRPQGRVVISNPMTDVDGLRRFIDAWLHHEGRSVEDWQAVRGEAPWRFDAVAAWQRGLAAGHDLRLLVVQGLQDRVTMRRQFPSLCEGLGLDGQQGGPSEDGRVLLVLHDTDGHGSEPTLAMHRLARDFFDTPPAQVATRQFPGLAPGAWRFDEASAHQLVLGREARKEGRRSRRAEGGGQSAVTPLPALAPAASAGVLLVSGSPGTWPAEWTKVLAGLRHCRRLDDELLRQGLRRNDTLLSMHLRDVEGSPAAGVEAAWRLGCVEALFSPGHQVLAALPEARVVYLLGNPIEAVAMGAQAGAGPLATRLAEAAEAWNASARAAWSACQGPDGERIRIMPFERLGKPEALNELLAWLGHAMRPAFERKQGRWRDKFQPGGGVAPWPDGLDADVLREVLLALDWAAYQGLSAPRGAVAHDASADAATAA